MPGDVLSIEGLGGSERKKEEAPPTGTTLAPSGLLELGKNTRALRVEQRRCSVHGDPKVAQPKRCAAMHAKRYSDGESKMGAAKTVNWTE